MWFLGIDVGTTHIKVAGVTADGTALPPWRVRTPVLQRDDAVFHDGLQIWDAVRDLVREYAVDVARSPDVGLLAGVAIATFGQEESFPVDASGVPLAGSRAWWETWPTRALDAATVAWLDSIEHYRVSGLRHRDNQSPERLAQLRRRDREAWSRMRRWVDFGAYLGFRLTGRWATSSTQITHSQLFDVATLAPHLAGFARLGLSPGIFPAVMAPGERIGDIRPDALPGVDLAPHAVLIMGGHDQVLAAYAEASRDSGWVLDSIGTAEYVMVAGAVASADERLYELRADVERGWSAEFAVIGWGLPTGKILQELADTVLDGDFERLLAAIDPARHDDDDVELDARITFAVSDLRDLGADLLTVTGVLDSDPPDAVARVCVRQLSARIRDTVELLADAAGVRLDDVVLTGSLFHRAEMVRHRQATWRLPLRVGVRREAVAEGAAQLARLSYDRRSQSVGA